MKLVNIIFENLTKSEYIDSVKKLYGDMKLSCKSDDFSDIVHFKLKSDDGKFDESFSRLINNNRLRQLENPTDISICEKIKLHDKEFSAGKKIQIK